jgi:hypothetical protein
MKLKLTGDIYLTIGLMLLAAFFEYYSLTYTSMRSSLLPGAASGLVFVIGAILLVKQLSAARKAEIARQEEAKSDSPLEVKGTHVSLDAAGEWKQNGVVFAWLVGFVILIYLFGFVISTFVLITSFLKVNKRGWPTSIIFALVMSAFVYFVFVKLLQSNLYPGIFTEGLFTAY